MTEFADYVAGRTVALVGPAPLAQAERDLVAEHDVVYMVGHHRHYDRCGIIIINSIDRGHYRAGTLTLPDHDWLVLKSDPRGMPKARQAAKLRGVPGNLVPIALNDLAQYQPADVNVYGANLYLDAPDRVYSDRGYNTRRLDVQWNGIVAHRPGAQHRILRDLRHRTGWLGQSDTLNAILDLDEIEYVRTLKSLWLHPAGKVAA
jgi:hypothetical protein